MPLQDLTPQLRTRLNRMERTVGLFIILATLLLLAGFGLYIYKTAEQRGWFKAKANFYTFTDTGEGLAVGAPVKLMGFPVGEILTVEPMPARGKGSDKNVKVSFVVRGTNNIAYLWTGNTRARLSSAGFLGTRAVDLTKGTNGYTIYVIYPVSKMALEDIRKSTHLDKLRLGEEIYNGTNLEFKAWTSFATNMHKFEAMGRKTFIVMDATTPRNKVRSVWNDIERHYEPVNETNAYALLPDEAPDLAKQIQGIVVQVQNSLPGVFHLTNEVAAVLANANLLTSNLNRVVADVHPVVTNLASITEILKNPNGSLGQWVIPTNLSRQLEATLDTTHGTISNANTTITTLAEQIGQSLENVAGITGNLNKQVASNTNLVKEVSDIIIHSDDLIQGLKRHWLLRSAFRTPKTNAPSSSPRINAPLRSPKMLENPPN